SVRPSSSGSRTGVDYGRVQSTPAHETPKVAFTGKGDPTGRGGQPGESGTARPETPVGDGTRAPSDPATSDPATSDPATSDPVRVSGDAHSLRGAEPDPAGASGGSGQRGADVQAREPRATPTQETPSTTGSHAATSTGKPLAGRTSTAKPSTVR